MALTLGRIHFTPFFPILVCNNLTTNTSKCSLQRPKEEKKEEEEKRIRPPGLGGRFGAAEMVVFLFVYLFLSPSLSGYHGYQ